MKAKANLLSLLLHKSTQDLARVQKEGLITGKPPATDFISSGQLSSGPVAGPSIALHAPAVLTGPGHPTHSSRMSTTSVRFSKTSCSVMTLGCSTCLRMLTSRSISSRLTPRRLAGLCRFLMNLAAYSVPVLFSWHFFTMANWPLWEQTQGIRVSLWPEGK